MTGSLEVGRSTDMVRDRDCDVFLAAGMLKTLTWPLPERYLWSRRRTR